MNRKKPKPKCNCPYCTALRHQLNFEMLYTDCGFLFKGMFLDQLTWRDQVKVGKIVDLYPVPIKAVGTAFLVEKGKEEIVSTKSVDDISKIINVQWQYVTCDNYLDR